MSDNDRDPNDNPYTPLDVPNKPDKLPPNSDPDRNPAGSDVSTTGGKEGVDDLKNDAPPKPDPFTPER